MGCWDMPPVTMAKLRARIDRDPKPVEKLARAVKRRGEFRMDGQMYKRPKGDPGPLLFTWYNSRQISFACECNCEDLFFRPELAGQVLEGWKSLVPSTGFSVPCPATPSRTICDLPPEENSGGFMQNVKKRAGNLVRKTNKKA